MFPLAIRSGSAIRAIREQTRTLICLNDSIHIRNFEKTMKNIHAAFEHILPGKSQFES
jgi:hypothetical protein